MFFWYTADDASFLEIEYNGILVCFSLLMPIQTMIAKFFSTNPRELPEERFVLALFSCVLAGFTINTPFGIWSVARPDSEPGAQVTRFAHLGCL
jgi:hypothetical protein